MFWRTVREDDIDPNQRDGIKDIRRIACCESADTDTDCDMKVRVRSRVESEGDGEGHGEGGDAADLNS